MQFLIGTKAARVCLAAQGDPLVEFELRRDQGVNGDMSASRAALIGGCTGTSNVLGLSASSNSGVATSGSARYPPSFHLEDETLDPNTQCRFPILPVGFEVELAEFRALISKN